MAFDELAEQGKSGILTFFGVELSSDEIAALDSADELTVVVRDASGKGGIRRTRVVGVDEVKVGIWLLVGPSGIEGVDEAHLVPAHVRDFQAGPGREADNFTLENAEASDAGVFLTALKKGLITDADAEEGAISANPFAQRFDKTLAGQAGHGVVETALTGKDEGVHIGKAFRRADVGGFDPGMTQSIPHALQIAAAVIDDAQVHLPRA